MLLPTSIVEGVAVITAEGKIHTPGTVVTTDDSALALVLSVSHKQRVLMF
jgi:hypothetical protein